MTPEQDQSLWNRRAEFIDALAGMIRYADAPYITDSMKARASELGDAIAAASIARRGALSVSGEAPPKPTLGWFHPGAPGHQTLPEGHENTSGADWRAPSGEAAPPPEKGPRCDCHQRVGPRHDCERHGAAPPKEPPLPWPPNCENCGAARPPGRTSCRHCHILFRAPKEPPAPHKEATVTLGGREMKVKDIDFTCGRGIAGEQVKRAPSPEPRSVEEILDHAWALLPMNEAANLIVEALRLYRSEKEASAREYEQMSKQWLAASTASAKNAGAANAYEQQNAALRAERDELAAKNAANQIDLLDARAKMLAAEDRANEFVARIEEAIAHMTKQLPAWYAGQKAVEILRGRGSSGKVERTP